MSSHPFTFPRVEGRVARQAHVGLPDDTFERELGREGFFGPATQMYHRNPPTGWTSWRGALRPRAFDLTKLADFGETVWDAPTILGNAACRMRMWRCAEPMRYLARNGDGDDLMFVHRGAGELYCDFGRLDLRKGDYVILPRATMWRLVPAAPMDLLLIEATNSSYRSPDRGMVGRQAVYDEGILDSPKIDEAFLAQQGPGDWEVLIRRRGEISVVAYPFNPLDAVGWQGDLCPVRLNVGDIRPLMSHRYHLPPAAHSTFVAGRFVICTFVPRPFETDPAALKVPYFHNNDDYDEVLFYHEGDFFSRDGIHPGMITWHPCGFTHGPHPKALARMFEQPKPMTDEYAVMLDTRDALEMGEAAAGIERLDYAESWRAKDGPVRPPRVPRPQAAE